MTRNLFLLVALALWTPRWAAAQDKPLGWPDLIEQADSLWYASDHARQVGQWVLHRQLTNGAWPKNDQLRLPLTKADLRKLKATRTDLSLATIDNGATTQELAFLDRLYAHQPQADYAEAFRRGLSYLLQAQYANGGWPQYFPLKKGYYSHITYNDHAMVRVLQTLRRCYSPIGGLAVPLADSVRNAAHKAFDKGVECILNTQYRQGDSLTVWCAQHDAVSLLPAQARAYELPSLSGKESAKVVLLLMSLPEPNQRVVKAVEAAVRWFEKVQLQGLREVRFQNEKGEKDKRLVADSLAGPIWARFYDLKTNAPFFCDRDGQPKPSYDQIDQERRAGYAWYGDEPKEVLKKYPKWKAKWAGQTNLGPGTVPKRIEYVVAHDGSGHFSSIAQALEAMPSFPHDTLVLRLKNGVYREKLRVEAWHTNLHLVGEHADSCRIEWDDHFGRMNRGRNSTFYTPTLFVEGNGFVARHLTVANTAGEVGQAVALSILADRVRIEHCRLVGHQDVLYLAGQANRVYLRRCYIEGTTDFIFGGGTAFFDTCTVHSLRNSYITAASTPQGARHGFVFRGCRLTAADSVQHVYLGRPWRVYAQTVFVGCHLGAHIASEAWHNWGKPEAEALCFYAECDSTGPGAKPGRVPWAKVLGAEQAAGFTPEAVLGLSAW